MFCRISLKSMPANCLVLLLSLLLIACTATPKPNSLLSATPRPVLVTINEPTNTFTPAPSSSGTRVGTSTNWPTRQPTLTPVPPTNTATLPPPRTPSPTYATNLVRTTRMLGNGLTWTECAVPVRDYAIDRDDVAFLESCIKWSRGSSAVDKKMRPETIEVPGGYYDFKLTIGKDIYETQMEQKDPCCHYFLLKNGKAIREETIPFLTYQPNVGLLNVGGKWVWELSSWNTKIIEDGVDLNEKFGLKGSYHPYEIKGKMIFVAQKPDKFQIMYDEKSIGPEFDEISMPYCCGMIHLIHANGQYWFVGRRGDSKYVVSIQ